MLNAGRLGLVFDDNTSSPVILRLSENESSSSQQVYNTVINGRNLGKNQVLRYQGGSVQAAADPSVPVTDYTVTFSSDRITFPDKALYTMELNKIYTLDIYFYLEGCDPDCSDSVSFDNANLHLPFTAPLARRRAADEKKRENYEKTSSYICASGTSALVAVTAATVAWFSIADNTRVRSMSLDIITDVDLRMDLDAHSTIDQYVKTLSFESIAQRIQQEKGFSMQETPLDPVTTSDYSVFTYENGSTVDATKGAYLEFTLHLWQRKI